MDFREGLLEAFSSPSIGERKRFVGGKRVLAYRTNGFRVFLGCRSALGMLLKALGVLLGGPWGSKKVESKPKPAAPAKPAVKKDASNAKLDWDAIQKRIEGAVKAGQITREQADARYLDLKKQYRPKPDTSSKTGVSKDNKPDPRIAFQQAAKEIRATVEDGKITAEQGRARLTAYRKHLAERQQQKAPKDVPGATQERRNTHEIKIHNVNGVKNIYVTENQRKITIIDDPNRGIKIEITDTQDGKPVTRTYSAKNIDELQKKNPEAHKLYKKYSLYAPSTR